MRVLLIKTSSMGDILHTLPALTDAQAAYPNISFDWVVEESFADIPAWHPAVKQVIPVALRRWRKNWLAEETRTAVKALYQRLRNEHYDIILDAQGLVKSAALVFLAKGLRVGLDWQSARELFASFAYQRRVKVNFHQHAIIRMRSLFSQALDYPLPTTEPQFALSPRLNSEPKAPYVVFLHGTTWATKEWPEIYWRQLVTLARSSGLRIKIGGGNANEVARARRIADNDEAVDVVPYLTISQMADLLRGAKGAVAVDTGFGHLAAALNIPIVSLYGATNAIFTGAQGLHSKHLTADFSCSPCLQRTCTFSGVTAIKPACFEALTPIRVWETLQSIWQH